MQYFFLDFFHSRHINHKIFARRETINVYIYALKKKILKEILAFNFLTFSKYVICWKKKIILCKIKLKKKSMRTENINANYIRTTSYIRDPCIYTGLYHCENVFEYIFVKLHRKLCTKLAMKLLKYITSWRRASKTSISAEYIRYAQI